MRSRSFVDYKSVIYGHRCASFTSRRIPPTPGRTGASRGSRTASPAGLRRRGHQVTVCTTDACDDSTRVPSGAAAGRRGGPGACSPISQTAWPIIRSSSCRLGLGNYLRRHAGTLRRRASACVPQHARRDGRASSPPDRRTRTCLRRMERRRGSNDACWPSTRSMSWRAGGSSPARRGCWRSRTPSGGSCGSWASPLAAIRVIPNPVDLDEFTSPVTPGRFRRRLRAPIRTAGAVSGQADAA